MNAYSLLDLNDHATLSRPERIKRALDLANAQTHASLTEKRLARLTAEGAARSADFFANEKAVSHLETFSLREYSL